MSPVASIKHSNRNTASIYYSKESSNDDGDDYKYQMKNVCPRNYQSTLNIQNALLDYKQFKAARTIQQAFRGWSEKRRFQSLKKASIITQRQWRDFYKTNNRFVKTEMALQEFLVEYYNTCATKIQALYRGWRFRKHHTDFYNLKKIHIGYLMDILYYLAQNMKLMKYYGQLPGVYSMRNSPCLSKCEDYLSTHGFRFHNQFVQTEWRATRARIAEYRRSFQHAIRYTPVPYAGHNTMNLCEQTYEYYEARTQKRIDNAILKVIAKFTEAKLELARGTYKQRRQKKYTRAWEGHKAQSKKRKMESGETFCDQLIDNMKHWYNTDGTLMFPKHIFENSKCMALIWKTFQNRATTSMSRIQLPECQPVIEKQSFLTKV